MVNDLARTNNGNGAQIVSAEAARALTQGPASVQPRTFEELFAFARYAAGSGFYGIRTPEQAIVILMTGNEIGLTAAQSLASIYVIENRPSLSAQLIAGLLLSRKDVCEYFDLVESDENQATYVTKRVGRPEIRMTYSIDDAEAANLLGKDNWKKNRKAMLRSRAASNLGRAVYPDILKGLATKEEIQDGEFTIIVDPTPEEIEADRRSQVVGFRDAAEGRSQMIEERKAAVQTYVDEHGGRKITKDSAADSQPGTAIVGGTMVETASGVIVEPPAALDAAAVDLKAKLDDYISKLTEKSPGHIQAVTDWLKVRGYGEDISSLTLEQYKDLRSSTATIFKTHDDSVKYAQAEAEKAKAEPEKVEPIPAVDPAVVQQAADFASAIDDTSVEDPFADEVNQ